MLFYYIISIEPQNDDDGEDYQSAAYYAAQVENEQFKYGRPCSYFISLQDFRSEHFDDPINPQNPLALLTIHYDESKNEYTATNLYIINSPHKENEHQFTPPLILADLNLKNKEMPPKTSVNLSFSLSGLSSDEYETETTDDQPQHPNNANSTAQPAQENENENEDEPHFSI